MQELDYNPSKKDLTDARIHHLLAEELKPRRVSDRLSWICLLISISGLVSLVMVLSSLFLLHGHLFSLCLSPSLGVSVTHGLRGG